MKRESLGSRLGFILLSAGCAIGIGNVWKFPYMAGQYGGGAFVLVYLFFLAIMGIPVMTMEFAMGRASRKSPVCMYQELEKKGQKWHIHGYAAMIGNYLLMMFYTSVTAWMLQYFVKMVTGSFAGKDSAGVEAVFNSMMGDAKTMILYMGIVVVIGFGVCAIGLQKGLERVTKYMMLALLGLMIVLAINSMFMEGGSEGLKFYLLPDFGRMADIGVGEVIVGAMNQAFFTLSLGIGSMAIFGSYINKDRSLLGEAVNVGILDTCVAFCSGLIIFPACFAFDVEVSSGPPLIFITLPNIFNDFADAKAGIFWGSMFFLFMSFAAMSTIFAVFENILSCTMDLTGWSRKKACLVNGIAMFILSIPCILGFSVWKDVQIAGKGIMDMEDFVVSNLLLPIGSLLFVLFCTTRYGWGWEKFLAEANEGKGLKVAKWMRPYMTFVLPVIILVLLIVGLIPSKG
ncbi:MAG: sodium-dependent transporter [Lachnospiraceae bacterium]|nr:sodium-dependent transporter [Lachnospiraceae bacterium]